MTRATVPNNREGDTHANHSPGHGSTPRLGRVDLGSVKSLGRYRLLRHLGVGGMSTVYLGYDGESDQHVAIKILADHLAFEPVFLDRFRREGNVLRLFQHPHLVRCFASGQDHATGNHYLILEYIDGPSVQQLLDQGRELPVGVAIRIALDIAHALAELHQAKYIHRDIKPGNILISPDGSAKLIDFGLTSRIDESARTSLPPASVGTPYYMSIEQTLNAARVDDRGDIFALGASLYHMLTGEVPFPGTDHHEVALNKEAGWIQPASRRNPSVPAELDQLLTRMLAREVHARLRSAKDLIEILEQLDLAAPSAVVPVYVSNTLLNGWSGAPACGSPEVVDDLAITQPELSSVPSTAGRIFRLKKGGAESERWKVRTPDGDGSWIFSSATTKEIVDWLQYHCPFPVPDIQVAKGQNSDFQPLGAFPEFREVVDFINPMESSRSRSGRTTRRIRRTSAHYRTIVAVIITLLFSTGTILASWLNSGRSAPANPNEPGWAPACGSPCECRELDSDSQSPSFSSGNQVVSSRRLCPWVELSISSHDPISR